MSIMKHICIEPTNSALRRILTVEYIAQVAEIGVNCIEITMSDGRRFETTTYDLDGYASNVLGVDTAEQLNEAA